MERKPITLPPPTPDQMEYLAMILRASEYDGSYVVGGPKKKADDGRVPDRETHWLIERSCSPPQYVCPTDNLSPDPWRALRFKTEREANDHRLSLNDWLRDESRVTEHVFINKR